MISDRPALQPRSIVLWHVLAGDAESFFARQIDAFNAAQTAVHVAVVKIDSGYTALIDKLQHTAPVDQPDIVLINSDAMGILLDSKLTIAPRECHGGVEPASQANLLPVVRATYETHGHLSSIPYDVSAPVLYIESSRYRAAGLDPSHPPRTPEELTDAARKIVASRVAAHGIVFDGWLPNWVVQEGAGTRGDLLLTPENGHGDRSALRVHLNTDANRRALEWIAGLVTDGSGLWLKYNASGFDDLVRLTQTSENAVMAAHTSGSIGDVERILEGGSFPGLDLTIAAVPFAQPGAIVGGSSLWVFDHGDAARAGSASEVVDWLSAPPQLAALDAYTGYAPPTTNVAADASLQAAWARDANLRVAYDVLRATPGTEAAGGAVAAPKGELGSSITDGFARMIEQRVGAGEVLASADTAIQTLLDLNPGGRD